MFMAQFKWLQWKNSLKHKFQSFVSWDVNERTYVARPKHYYIACMFTHKYVQTNGCDKKNGCNKKKKKKRNTREKTKKEKIILIITRYGQLRKQLVNDARMNLALRKCFLF